MSPSSFSVLPNLPLLAHERFSAHRELESLLKKTLRGEVRFDLGSRALYAADASNYRQLPIGVIFPRDAADVEAALAACRATGAAVLPRGAGTSLAGQCVNVAVVFDYSRFMNSLEELDPAQATRPRQPGIVLDRLRDAAELHHLTYAPDPATHSRCTLGGMIGNNSCGVHGLLGGKVVDNVESLDIVLYDGTRMTVGATTPAELDALVRAGGRVGQIYAGLQRIRDTLLRLKSAKNFPASRAASPATTSTSCCLKTTSMSRARWSVQRAPAPMSSPPRSISLPARPSASSPCSASTIRFSPPTPFRSPSSTSPSASKASIPLLVDFMRRKGLAFQGLDRLPPGLGFLLVEMGAWSRRRSSCPGRGYRTRLAIVALPARWPTSARPKRPSLSGMYANPLSAVWSLFPASPTAGKAGRMPPFLPRSLATICAPSMASWPNTALRGPLYGHYGQGCVHIAHQFRLRYSRRIKKIPRIH